LTRPASPTKRPTAQAAGRRTAVRPGDRRDGQPLVFGWGRHLTRAQKQRYRQLFVVAAGAFVFVLVALVLGIGALQQFYFKPRLAVATVNGQKVERQWYDKNVAYRRFVLQHEGQDEQSQLQGIYTNAFAKATATASAQPAAAEASPAPQPSAAAGAASGTPSAAPTPAPTPTLAPEDAARASALQAQLSDTSTKFSGVEEQTVQDLIDALIMRQNAAKLGITVSQSDVSDQGQQTTDELGGEDAVKDLFTQANLKQSDFDQIQYDLALRTKFEEYFADHPDAAPAASPTPAPSPTPEVSVGAGPVPPTPTALPTPEPAVGSDELDRWLQQQRQTAKISRASFPLPS